MVYLYYNFHTKEIGFEGKEKDNFILGMSLKQEHGTENLSSIYPNCARNRVLAETVS